MGIYKSDSDFLTGIHKLFLQFMSPKTLIVRLWFIMWQTKLLSHWQDPTSQKIEQGSQSEELTRALMNTLSSYHLPETVFGCI